MNEFEPKAKKIEKALPLEKEEVMQFIDRLDEKSAVYFAQVLRNRVEKENMLIQANKKVRGK